MEVGLRENLAFLVWMPSTAILIFALFTLMIPKNERTNPWWAKWERTMMWTAIVNAAASGTVLNFISMNLSVPLPVEKQWVPFVFFASMLLSVLVGFRALTTVYGEAINRFVAGGDAEWPTAEDL